MSTKKRKAEQTHAVTMYVVSRCCVYSDRDAESDYNVKSVHATYRSACRDAMRSTLEELNERCNKQVALGILRLIKDCKTWQEAWDTFRKHENNYRNDSIFGEGEFTMQPPGEYFIIEPREVIIDDEDESAEDTIRKETQKWESVEW